MRKIFAILILALAFTAATAAVTVIAHTDQAMADGGGCSGC